MLRLVPNSVHENTPYLPDIKLSELIVATTNVAEATDGAGVVFVVVPTPFVRGRPPAVRPREPHYFQICCNGYDLRDVLSNGLMN